MKLPSDITSVYPCVTPLFCSLSSVEEIVKAIQDFDGLQALRLEGNTVGVEAAKTIAKALETKSEITVLSGPHSASLSS